MGSSTKIQSIGQNKGVQDIICIKTAAQSFDVMHMQNGVYTRCCYYDLKCVACYTFCIWFLCVTCF